MHCSVRMCFCLPAIIAAQAQDAPPIQVVLPVPLTLDLREVDGTRLLPGEDRNPARLAAARSAWEPLLARVDSASSVRLVLPDSPERIPLLLAASQALKARDSKLRVYVAFQPELPPVMDELAWGAVEGGALLPSDLGPDPERWRGILAQAQGQFLGRSWFLWMPADPGALGAQLLGDGARLVLPDGGPGARLARGIPSGYTDVEGGLGDLTLRKPTTGEALRWSFQGGAWVPARLPSGRHEVLVLDQDRYDVGALLARVRATQLRDRIAVRNVRATLDMNLHIQAEGGGGDLGFRFLYFEKTGEPEELLRQEIRFNGVRANLSGNSQLPLIESRTSVAAPAVLTLTERYRYSDGGPAGKGLRRLLFEPVDADPTLFDGELVVEEASGRVLAERSHRSNLPGMVRSERREITYGEALPGVWRVRRIHTSERWIGAGGTTQVLRDLDYRDFRINGDDFDNARSEARASESSILQNTPEGYRYFVKQSDGSRKLETRVRSGGCAAGGVVLMEPGMESPVTPMAGLLLYDFNALDKGIQYSLLTAGVFNMGSATVPRAFLGTDLSGSSLLSLLGGTERPVEDGKLQDKDGVKRRSQALEVALGRDLGAGFRFELKGQFNHDAFSDPEDKYKTPGFKNPPSGWTRMGIGELSWQHEGFQFRGTYGKGLRPDGEWGAPGAVRKVPDQGRLERWDGALLFDRKLTGNLWLSASAGYAGGRGFDRFMPLSFDGRVSGIRPYALLADRMTYGGLSIAFPTGPNLRLTLGLDHGRAHDLTDQKTYRFTGMKVSGDLPGFWWFTTIRVDLGAGIQSDIKGVRTVNGMVSFLHLF